MSTTPIPSALLHEILASYRQDSRRACALATEALGLTQGDPVLRAQLLRARAMSLGCAGEIEAAQADFTEALTLARAHEESDLEGHCLHGLAVALHHRGLHQEALVQMYQALDVRRETKNLVGLQISLNSLAAFHGSVGNYSDAIECLTEAHALARQNKSEQDVPQILTNLALVYCESGQQDEALQHFEQALALYPNYPDDSAECNTLLNYVNLLLRVGRNDEALSAAQRALRLAEKHQSLYQELSAQVALAKALPNSSEAERLLRAAHERAQGCSVPEPRLKATQALGAFLLSQARYREALPCLRDALAQAERLGTIATQGELHQLLSKLHEAQGDFACALRHFQQYHQRHTQLHQHATAQRIQSQLARKEAERTRSETELLRRQAHEDPLTELYNRRYLELFLTEELARSQREKLPLSVLLIDIDNFKQINDTHSHRTGDAVLLALSRLFRQAIRQKDVLVRHSGDEFILVTPETPLPDAQLIAERLRARVQEHDWTELHPSLQLTISIGVADLLAHADPFDLVDQRLYQAKRAGKNQIAA